MFYNLLVTFTFDPKPLTNLRLFHLDDTLIAEVYEKESGKLCDHRIYINDIINENGLEELYLYWLSRKDEIKVIELPGCQIWQLAIYSEKYKNVIRKINIEKFIIIWTIKELGYKEHDDDFINWILRYVTRLDGNITVHSAKYLVMGATMLLSGSTCLSELTYESFITHFITKKINQQIFV